MHEANLVSALTVDAVGDRYSFLATGETTGGQYALWHAVVAPGGGPPPHIHRREDEAFYVLEGTLSFFADGQRLVRGPGSFIHLPRGLQHQFKNETDRPVRVLIQVAPAGLEGMFVETGREVTELSSPISPASREEIDRLLVVAPRYGVEIIHGH
jgi:quercetin dioxygenase-like cupin family protein